MTQAQLSKLERELHEAGGRLIDCRARRLYCVKRASRLSAEFRAVHARYAEAHRTFFDVLRRDAILPAEAITGARSG